MRALRIIAVALVDAVVLCVTWPNWAALAAAASSPAKWIAIEGSDQVAATLAAIGVWVVAAWVATALLTTALAALPGRLGRLGAVVTRAVVPGIIRRIVASATGLTIVLTPTLAAATTPSGGSGPDSPAATSAPAWPSTAPPVTPVRAPGPEWPTSRGPAPRGPAFRGPASQPQTGRTTVIVRPGDTLWAIAARRLGPAASSAAVAAEWPRWFAANRAVIGPDPNLLRPGQVLRTPHHQSAQETT